MSLGTYDGDPGSPFPWLSWNNRPYVSHLELMLVPASSASHLFDEADTLLSNPYSDAVFPAQFYFLTPFRAPFGHLLNFMHSSFDLDKAAHYYRLFDLVEVPSRFVAAETWYNPHAPDSFRQGAATRFAPPFNRMSRFRDPGRININTVFDERIWQALYDPYFSRSTPWREVELSRQGYDGPAMNSNYPTRFANPFRSAGSADLMPPVPGLRKTSGVEATLLRPKVAGQRELLFGFSSTADYNNSEKNAYFRYQALERLGNLVTTHSNVFAVWITVGFFEVDASTGQLGQELGSDTGDVKRHRGFYVIDRSIPVAFEPGRNHNVDRAVVLSRFIE